jgi:hypothetical protein
MAFSGFLVIDLTIFVLTIACSIRLWTRKEPFLHRLLIDGAFVTYTYHSTSRYYEITPGLFYYWYVAALWNRS